MQLIQNPARQEWPSILARPVLDNAALLAQVGEVLDDIRKSGDVALGKYIIKFDGEIQGDLRVSASSIVQAGDELDIELKQAIDVAFNNISRFHTAQQELVQPIETTAGVVCWRKSLPISRVGLYIPGGSAPLFSTVLMLGIPAMLAGCKEVVICTPAGKDGTIHPAILYAAGKVGIQEIYRIGGAQAIAAMASGTSTIAKVDKIFGPGNQYVTAAKQLVQMQGVAIDMPAGPSEVCVLADETANPAFIAADLLSQAEHGPDSQVLLVTNNASIINDTNIALETQLQQLGRKSIAELALQNSKAILVANMDEAMDMVNAYAAEHLIIASTQYEKYMDKVEHAGSVFLGNLTPESAGDYASGTNHTLPTNGYARAYSGVSLDSFVKKVTFQHINESGIRNLGPAIITMAQAEGLDAHANAVKIRLNQ
jgi:histidinol dehydrogenase